MQIKALFGLGLAAAVAVYAAMTTLQERDARAGPEDLGMLFEGLDERINDVASVRIFKEGESLTFSRSTEDPNEWTVESIGGYPAKFEPIKRVIVRIANMAIKEKKTNKPTNYEKLGVTDPEAEGSTARLLSLSDASGTELASVILGETTYQGRNPITYARRTGEDRVYLCDGRIDAKPTLRSWIDTIAIKLANDRVQSVTVTHADGEVIKLRRSEENHTQFQVENLPPGRELRYEGVASSIASALSSLNFDEVRPVADVDFQAEPVAQTRYVCHDGLVVLVETARAEDKTWARIVASYEAPPAPPEPEPAVEDEGEGEGKEGDEEADAAADPAPPANDTPDPEVVRAEVEEIGSRHAAWAYALPSYKADAIAKHMNELLADLPEPEEEEPVEPLEEALEAAPEAEDTIDLGEDPSSTDDGEG